ncbi:MAG: hypothetical protein AAF846_03310 [Chloroflexota bacterium]
MDMRNLKRTLNALTRLRKDMRGMIPMEVYKGMGNVVVRTYTALHTSVKQELDDPFINALVIDLPDDATDRQKVTQVNLLAGQLLSYVEDIYETLESQNQQPSQEREEDRVRQRFNRMMDDSDLN